MIWWCVGGEDWRGAGVDEGRPGGYGVGRQRLGGEVLGNGIMG